MTIPCHIRYRTTYLAIKLLPHTTDILIEIVNYRFREAPDYIKFAERTEQLRPIFPLGDVAILVQGAIFELSIVLIR